MDSLQQVSNEVSQENFETIPWSPTWPNNHSSRSQSQNSAGFWITQRGPVPLELQGLQEEFAAAVEPEWNDFSDFPSSSDHSDQGFIAADLRKALPTLLRENSAFRERMYAQSDIERDASPMADHIHEKIVREQCQPQGSGSSPLWPDIPSNMLGLQHVLLGKTPPSSPPFKLPHFSSQSTLTADHAPLHRRHPHQHGRRNIQLLESLRKNEIGADPLFTLPLRTRPPLPDTASANEVAFLLRTQAQRRRKQIHSERIGESVFPGQERRAVRRRLKHVALGKDHDVWPPSTAEPPALAYSEIDEERVVITTVSPTKGCPGGKLSRNGNTKSKRSKADRIPMTEDTTTRVVTFLKAQGQMEATTATIRAPLHRVSTPKVGSTFDMTAHAHVVSVRSGKSLYLHPDAQIDGNSESSTNRQPKPVPEGHKAQIAHLNPIEQFPAPTSVTPEEEPIKRAGPPKANIAGFEEHSKRGQKRKQRPESLTYHPGVHKATKPVVRTPLSPRSTNIGIVVVGEGHSSFDDMASPAPLAATDASNLHATAGSQAFWHLPSAFDVHDQENTVTEHREITKAQSSPSHSVPRQSSRVPHPARNARKSNFSGQVPVPILQPVSPLGPHPPSPTGKCKHRHRHRRGPVVVLEEGLGKAMVDSSNKSKEGAIGREKCPTPGSMDSAKAKEHLRHLHDHVDSLSRERGQAVRQVSVLEEEVMRLKLTVAVLKREVGHWEA